MTIGGPARASKYALRLAWLRAHPTLLARLPGASEDVSEAQSAALGEALALLMEADLYARTSGRFASRWGIRLLVSDLRGEHVFGRKPTGPA